MFPITLIVNTNVEKPHNLASFPQPEKFIVVVKKWAGRSSSFIYLFFVALARNSSKQQTVASFHSCTSKGSWPIVGILPFVTTKNLPSWKCCSGKFGMFMFERSLLDGTEGLYCQQYQYKQINTKHVTSAYRKQIKSGSRANKRLFKSFLQYLRLNHWIYINSIQNTYLRGVIPILPTLLRTDAHVTKMLLLVQRNGATKSLLTMQPPRNCSSFGKLA